MKTQRYGHRWTDAELTKLVAMWADGTHIDEIAKFYQVTPHAIRQQTQRMRADGIPVPHRKRGNVAGRTNQSWTQSEVEYLIRRRNESATCDQIAIELERSFGGVQGMIARLRRERVPVRMLGMGVRRLWSAETIRAAIAGRGLIPRDEAQEVAR